MAELKQLRGKIDDVDGQILRLLGERAKICGAIGSAKKKQGLPVKDAARETEVYNRVRDQAAKLGLNSVQVEAVYREIVNMCSSVQE
jgi:chorismate mutase / prephenate dehydratase